MSAPGLSLIEQLRRPLEESNCSCSPPNSSSQQHKEEEGRAMGDSVGREGEEEEGEEGEEEEEEEEGPLVQSHHGSRPAAAPASSTSPLRGWRHSSGFAAKPRLAKQAALQDGVVGKAAEWLEGAGGLARRYGAPPFSVLDARKGYWKARRRFWEVEYRIHSEFGRPDNLLGYKGLGCDAARGTSVFCPVLCELCYRWFCPAGSAVLDPFAGGRRAGASPHGRGYGTWDSTCRARRSTRTASRRSTSRNRQTGWGKVGAAALALRRRARAYHGRCHGWRRGRRQRRCR